jgi:hypothetical protein
VKNEAGWLIDWLVGWLVDWLVGGGVHGRIGLAFMLGDRLVGWDAG